MQTSSVESTGNLERRVTFRLPAEQLEDQVGGRLREIARTARIKGFRPGKVPTKVIEQRFGEQVRAEILDGLLREGFDQAVSGGDYRIAGTPSIEPAGDAGDGELSYVATFEVVPDFGDLDLSTLSVVRNSAEVEEADIDRMIENLRLQRQSWTKVTREAREGDMVNVETWAEVGGERHPAEGVEKGSTVIGNALMYPPLEQALAGLAPGEEKVEDIEFPADWPAAAVAGKTAAMHLKMVDVHEPVLPEVDAPFIRSFGVKSGEAGQFRGEIRSNLERELKGALMTRLRREVGEKLNAAYAHVDVPARLVDNEARALAQMAMEDAARQGQRVLMEPGAFRETAEKRIRMALLVGEVARRNHLSLDRVRLQETLRLIASTYEDPKQVVDLYARDQQLMAGLQNRVMEEQVIDWIAERATHEDQAISFQEAITPQA